MSASFSISAQQELRHFFPRSGVGYQFKDGTILLGGATPRGVLSADTIAALVLIPKDRAGHVALYGLAELPGTESGEVKAIAALSADEVVAARERVGADSSKAGVVLSWIRVLR